LSRQSAPGNERACEAGLRPEAASGHRNNRLMNLFRPLGHRPFALLWSGQATSRLGDSLYRIALAWWVLEKTGSATAMGAVLVFSSVPMLIFLLLGGVATDRLPRLRVMFASDTLSGLVVAAVAILAFSGQLQVWHIYLASITFGMVRAFFLPAYTATIPEITPREILPSANSLTSLSQSAAGVIGPAVGAAIVALSGTALAFGLDALSFFISAGCVLPILWTNPAFNLAPRASAAEGGTPPAGGRKGLRSVVDEFLEGFKTVMGSPWLWVSIAIFSLINVTLDGPQGVSLPFLVKEHLHAGVGTLGLFASMSSAGFAVGALWLGSLARIRRRGLLLYLGILLAGVSLAVFGLSVFVPFLAAAAFLGGLFISVGSLIWTNSLQELVPRQLLGRVSSIDALGSFVLLPIGYGIVGWATDRIGAPSVFVLGGVATFTLALLALLHPAIRGLD